MAASVRAAGSERRSGLAGPSVSVSWAIAIVGCAAAATSFALAVAGGLWPSAGAAHPAHALSVGKALNPVLLIGSWRRRLMGASGCDPFTFRLAHA